VGTEGKAVNEDPVSLIIFSRDPGGANQMVALHGLLAGWWRSESVEWDPEIAAFRRRISCDGDSAAKIVSVAKDYARDVWSRAGQEFVDWDDVEGEDPAGKLDRLVAGRPVGALLSGTSDVDDDTDVMLWSAAAQRALPTHVFVDQDSNVERRFVTTGGVSVRPDFVYLPDSNARDSLLKAGWPADRLAVIPPVHLLRQQDEERGEASQTRIGIRERWGARDETRVILFASENVEELASLGKRVPYSEYACLEKLLAAVAGVVVVPNLTPTGDDLVVVRPHPKDRRGKYDQYAARYSHVAVSAEGTPAQAISAADIVVGMRSALLEEAGSLGRQAISLVGS
jgi:hypothetical protein